MRPIGGCLDHNTVCADRLGHGLTPLLQTGGPQTGRSGQLVTALQLIGQCDKGVLGRCGSPETLQRIGCHEGRSGSQGRAVGHRGYPLIELTGLLITRRGMTRIGRLHQGRSPPGRRGRGLRSLLKEASRFVVGAQPQQCHRLAMQGRGQSLLFTVGLKIVAELDCGLTVGTGHQPRLSQGILCGGRLRGTGIFTDSTLQNGSPLLQFTRQGQQQPSVTQADAPGMLTPQSRIEYLSAGCYRLVGCAALKGHLGQLQPRLRAAHYRCLRIAGQLLQQYGRLLRAPLPACHLPLQQSPQGHGRPTRVSRRTQLCLPLQQRLAGLHLASGQLGLRPLQQVGHPYFTIGSRLVNSGKGVARRLVVAGGQCRPSHDTPDANGVGRLQPLRINPFQGGGHFTDAPQLAERPSAPEIKPAA